MTVFYFGSGSYMKGKRDEILDCLDDLIFEFIGKSKNARIRDKDTARLRIQYANSLARLISSYNQLLKDTELESIAEELEALRHDFEEDKKKYS